jgi:uncharacterized protein YgiM (DUF1202 family)
MKRRVMFFFLIVAVCSISAFAQEKNVIVTSAQANIRETPSKTAKVIGKVKKGNVLVASANDGDWYYVVFGKVRGWIHYTTIKKPLEDESSNDNLSNLDAYIINQKPDAFKKNDKWQYVTSSATGNYYYSTARIAKAGSHLYAWIKITTKTANDYFLERAAFEIEKEAFKKKSESDKVNYFLEYWQFNCSIRFQKIQQSYVVWEGGDIETFTISGWKAPLGPVVPDTVDEEILEKVCK